MAESLTYALVNGFGLVAALGLAALVRQRISWRRLHAVLGVMVLMTLVFDSCLVLMDTYRYNPARVSGWLLGCAPIEDVAYTVAASILMPVLWEKLKSRKP